jgi:hypothetical protein
VAELVTHNFVGTQFQDIEYLKENPKIGCRSEQKCCVAEVFSMDYV